MGPYWSLEFGVWNGESINYLASKKPHNSIYGFDSFAGLEEDWSGTSTSRSYFDRGGKLPKVEKNVTLIKGWFEDTLPIFITNSLPPEISIIHLDADTYKPTIYVLNSFKSRILQGSIIIFDEYFGYPNWQSHEHRAWMKFTDETKVKFKCLAYSNMQVAFQVE